MRLSLSRPASDPAPEILFQDEDILVAVKPSGIPSQPDKLGSRDLLSILQASRGAEDGASDSSLKLVNRLDRPVGGLILLTCSEAAERWFSPQNTRQKMRKIYTAVTCGRLPAQRGELTDFLLKNEKSNLSRIVHGDVPGAKKAALAYEVEETTESPECGGLSLVRITLLTGRHHQIRVQLSHAGSPVYGDCKYNPLFGDAKGWHRIALFASELSFAHPKTHKEMTFRADPFRYEAEAFAVFPKAKTGDDPLNGPD